MKNTRKQVTHQRGRVCQQRIVRWLLLGFKQQEREERSRLYHHLITNSGEHLLRNLQMGMDPEIYKPRLLQQRETPSSPMNDDKPSELQRVRPDAQYVHQPLAESDSASEPLRQKLMIWFYLRIRKTQAVQQFERLQANQVPSGFKANDQIHP